MRSRSLSDSNTRSEASTRSQAATSWSCCSASSAVKSGTSTAPSGPPACISEAAYFASTIDRICSRRLRLWSSRLFSATPFGIASPFVQPEHARLGSLPYAQLLRSDDPSVLQCSPDLFNTAAALSNAFAACFSNIGDNGGGFPFWGVIFPARPVRQLRLPRPPVSRLVFHRQGL